MAEDQDIQEPTVRAPADLPQGDPDKPASGPVLAQTDRDRLAGIVQKMKDNGESDDNILTAVNGFKQKYGQAPGGPKDAATKTDGGPTTGQAKSAIRDIRNIGANSSGPETSMNPAVKPFKSYEDALNGLSQTNQRIQTLPQTVNSQQGADYYQKTMPGLQAASQAYKGQLTAEEVKAGGTLKDIDGQFLKDSKNYITPDGTLDYGKIHDAALAASQQYGGDRAVGEVIYNRAANALKFQQMKPDVDAEFKRLSGQAPADFLGGSKTAADIGSLKSHYQNDFTTEATRSQDVISKAATNIFAAKYQPALEHIAGTYGQDSEQFKQAYATAQQGLTGDLRDIQVKENARLLRIRSEMSRQMGDQVGDIEGKDQGLMDNYNTLYNKAYQNVQQNKDAAKSLVYSLPEVGGGNMAKLFFQSLWSGVNGWAATRGAGLVGAGFNNPITDWMRSRQTAAESNDIPAGPAINPATYAVSAGKMIGQMLPDITLTALTKNPTLSGLEFAGSSTLSGMGDVYNQAKADGYNEAEAQQKTTDFAGKNFTSTLPANLLMGASILANLKGAGGFLTNSAKEVVGGLGAALPQQYLTATESREGKTLEQFMREDAPRSALENVIALAAGAPIMRAVGHLTSAMGAAKVNAPDRQFYSDLIDKQGPNAAHATLELQYLNGALDDAGLVKAKQLVDDIVKTKTGLTQLDVHPDHQKLFLETQHDIQDLRDQHTAATDDTVKKLLETKIKEKQGQAQDALTGKASYVKFTTPTGNDFVVPMDKAEATMSDPAVQRDMAAGTMRAQAFGDEKEIAPMTQRINEINQSATNTKTAQAAAGEVPIDPVAPEAPQITEVRHGETSEDESGHVSGTDGIPLNETGQQEAERLADQAQTRDFTKVVGSDVARNIETAKGVADKLGIPHEIIPGFNSWDVGQFNGASEEEYNKAENYFVQHPDATEFEGKQINETFNQYKDRVIKARTELEDKNQGNTLLVNHSGNINVWDAYKASGDKWDEAAKEHYLNATDAEPAVLPPTKEEEAVAAEAEKEGPNPELERTFHEEKAIMDVHDPEKDAEIHKLFEEELKKINDEKANESGGPVLPGGESEGGNSGADAASGRSEAAAVDKERVRPDDKTKGGSGDTKGDAGQSEPTRFSTRDEFERALKDSLASDRIAGEPIEAGGKSHSLDQYVTKAKAVLGQLFPDHSIRAYETEKEYMEKEGRPVGSAGVHDPAGKYIALNLERIRKMGAENTVFHEVIHPIVHEALESRPGAVDSAYSKLVEMKGVPGMEKIWEHEEQYRDRGLKTMKVEAITEFLTHVADGRIDPDNFKTSLKTKLIDTVNRIFKALGIDRVISTAQDIKRLADTVKEAFDKADATPVEKALGRRSDGESGDKMDNIAGEKSSTHNRDALEQAKARTEKGDDAEDIFKDTNWYKDPHDKKWKYELPNESRMLENKSKEPGPLNKVIDYPSLFEAYPDLKEFPISYTDLPKDAAGEFDGSSIMLNKKNDEFLNHRTLLHEIQHVIQTKEGFAEGTDPEAGGMDLLKKIHRNALRELADLTVNMSKKGSEYNGPEVIDRINRLKKTVDVMNRQTEMAARRAYEATSGETEAENVENRLNPEIRKKGSPLETRKRYSDLITSSIVDGKISFPNRPDKYNADIVSSDQRGTNPMRSAIKDSNLDGSEKMDAVHGDDESKIRKMIQRAPDAMTDADISQSIQKTTGKSAADADDLVKSVREEQSKGLAKLVDEALAAGKQTLAQAKANAPKAPTAPKGLAKILGRWFFDKQDDVSDVKSIIRQNKGNEEFQADRVWKASNKMLNDWNKVPTKQQLQFILGMERPDLLKGSSPETLAAAQAYRDRLDKTYDIIKKALPNINFTEDYFPHFWDKPDEVKNYFASTLSKQPMEGSKSFAKQRFFDTILEGLRKGYKLTTTNPEELVRLAEANAWKFQTARAIFDDMHKMGYLKYSTAKDLPADWQGVDDKMFNKIGACVDKDGNANLAMGQYMMPPDVAKMMNQYLSLGLKGSLPDFIRNYNNIKNAFQLGVGAFHLGTTSLESTVSGVARGIQLLTTLRPGNMLNGLGQIAASATFVPNLAMDLRRGWKAMADYHKGLQTDDVQNLVNANAKVGKQKMYSLDAAYNMKKAFGRLRADNDFKQIPKILWNSLLYLPEALNKPLMEKWVPGLKVGGYLRSLDAEMASRKNMSPAELQQAKEKIWDSMDDRLGQVVYDNRFMNKTVKDLGFMSIRSLGWTGGTLAAGAKGIGEIPLSANRMIHGEGMTQRTAYLFALPMTVGLYGAYYMMMTSGQAPETAQDYFYPKDGTQNPDGTDHRVDLPSYMKDMISYGNSPIKTLVNKTSPIINDAIELYKNKDFYGAKIYGEDDPWYQRGLEKLQYLGGNMTPFSFKQKPGDEKSLADQFTTRQGVEQKFGIMPAPKEMERTDTQNKIMAAYGKQFGSEEGKTADEMEQQIARRHLRDFLHNGGSWNDASDELKSKANISEAGQQKFIDDSALDPYEKDFRGLPKAEKIKLFEQMSDTEQGQYKKYMPDDYNPNQ